MFQTGHGGDRPETARRVGMVVQFRDGQRTLQHKPVDHIGHLAQPTADGFADDHKPLTEAAPS